MRVPGDMRCHSKGSLRFVRAITSGWPDRIMAVGGVMLHEFPEITTRSEASQ